MLLLKKRHGASESEKHKLVSEANLVDKKNTLQGKLPLKTQQKKKAPGLEAERVIHPWIIIKNKEHATTVIKAPEHRTYF